MWESIFVLVSLFLSVSLCLCLSLSLHLLIAAFLLSLWILKHAGNLQEKLLPCMRTKQSAAGGGRTVAKTCGAIFADGGRRAHPQAVVGSGRRAADNRET